MIGAGWRSSVGEGSEQSQSKGRSKGLSRDGASVGEETEVVGAETEQGLEQGKSRVGA